MKKIFSLALAMLMVLTMIPTAFAACDLCGQTCPVCGGCLNPDCPSDSFCGHAKASSGTSVVLNGKYASAAYTITVPAQLAPGETGQVQVIGAWDYDQTLSVSCPDKVTLTYKEQSLDVSISFEGITQIGSAIEEFNITKDITVGDVTVAFGTWTGRLDYTVDVTTQTAPKMLMFRIARPEISASTVGEFQYEEGMTWGEWINSEYNTEGYRLAPSPFGVTNASGEIDYWPCVATSGTPSYYVVYVDENVNSYNHYLYATEDRLVENADWFTSTFSGGSDD